MFLQINNDNIYDYGANIIKAPMELVWNYVTNLKFMKKGKAPHYSESIDVPKELHHIEGRNIPNPHNETNLLEVWPWEHDDIDPYRFYIGPRP